ncbi:MAG: hypothetical protein GY802_26295 [Gammaproteobacteria bacterium]|nr:hypothetical protein [Gammaproteobacteria bacterium]
MISAGFSLGYTAKNFAPFTFHFFPLSFMSLVLIGVEKNANHKEPIYRGGMWLTLIWTISLALQTLIGFVVIGLYNGVSGNDLSGFLGAIATYGYTMGPGQALTYGGLEKIAALMQERPGVSVTLCAYTNSADRNLLLPETAEIAVDELELNDEQIAVLEKLGEARRDQIEDYLVAKKVDPARLISCDTEHREGTKPGGVEISI